MKAPRFQKFNLMKIKLAFNLKSGDSELARPYTVEEFRAAAASAGENVLSIDSRPF